MISPPTQFCGLPGLPLVDAFNYWALWGLGWTSLSPGGLFIPKEHWASSRGGGSIPKEQTPRHSTYQIFVWITFADVPLAKASHMANEAQHHCGRGLHRGMATEWHDSVGTISLTIYHKISIQFIHQIFPGHLLCVTHFARHLGTVVNNADMILALIHTFGRETVNKQWQMCSELLRSSGCYGNLQHGKTRPRDQERRPWEMMLKLRQKEWAGISYVKAGRGGKKEGRKAFQRGNDIERDPNTLFNAE